MRQLARLFPHQVLDVAPRGITTWAFVLLLTLPLRPGGGSGFADGLATGASGGASTTSGLLALLLAMCAPWLGDGIVSRTRAQGTVALIFPRPVSRSGWYLSRWLAGLVCLGTVSIAAVLAINLAWRNPVEGGPGLSMTGAAASSIVIWSWVGSTVLLLSAVVERGEALYGSLLVVIPLLLTAGLPPDAWPARLAAGIPSRPMLRSARSLLAGELPAGPDLVPVLGGGILVLWIGLFLAARRDVPPGE